MRRNRVGMAALIGGAVIAATLVVASPAGASTDPTCVTHQVINHAYIAPQLYVTGTACTVAHSRVGHYGILVGETGQKGVLNVVASTVGDGRDTEYGIGLYDSSLNLISSTINLSENGILGGGPYVAITHSVVYGAIGTDVTDPKAYIGGFGALTIKQSAMHGSIGAEGTGRALLEDTNFYNYQDEFGGYQAAIENSSFGDLYIFQNPDQGTTPTTEMCNVHVRELLQMDGAGPTDHIILGGNSSPSGTCSNPTVTIGSNLLLQGNQNTSPIDLRHVVIYGNLICDGNAKPPIFEDVTVHGTISPACYG